MRQGFNRRAQHFRAGLQGPCIAVIGLLSRNHVQHFTGQIDVGILQRALIDFGKAIAIGGAEFRSTRQVAVFPFRAGGCRQAL